MFDWKKFIKYKTAVLCKTKEEAQRFVEELRDNSFIKPASFDFYVSCWDVYERDTCYVHDDGEVFYSSKSFYLREGLEIVDFESFFGVDYLEPALKVNEPLSEGKKLLERVIKHYGEKAQMIVAIEEMSELTKALTKDMRGSINKDHITEEMADVYICLEQLKIIHGITDDALDMWIRWKLERTEQKLKEVQGE